MGGNKVKLFGCEKQPVSIDMDSLNMQLQVFGFESIWIRCVGGKWYAVLNVDMEYLGDIDFSTSYGDGSKTPVGAVLGVYAKYLSVYECMKGDIK